MFECYEHSAIDMIDQRLFERFIAHLSELTVSSSNSMRDRQNYNPLTSSNAVLFDSRISSLALAGHFSMESTKRNGQSVAVTRGKNRDVHVA